MRVCKKRLKARWGWPPFYWKHTCEKELQIGLETKKASHTFVNIQGPSWETEFPLFIFEDPQDPVIEAVDGKFSPDLF